MSSETNAWKVLYRKEDRKDFLPAAVLSCAVHTALFAALFTAFHWQTQSETVYAELWAPEDVSGGNDPTGAAKLEEKPAPEEPKAPETETEPEPEPEPQKAAEPEPDPEEERRAEELEEAARAEEARQAEEAARIEAERVAEEARKAEEARRAEDERLAQERARAEEIERQRQEAIEAEARRLEEEKRREDERLAQERLAEEQRRAEEARKAEEARRLEVERLKAEEARKQEEARQRDGARKIEEARKAEEKRKAEEARRIAEKKAAEERARIAREVRQQELARLSAKADPNSTVSGTTKGDPKNVRQNLTGSARARYGARVAACIRPHIMIEVPSSTVRGQYQAIYSVRLLPTGEQVGAPKQEKASGWAAYDAAVERAIRRCNPFPRPDTGQDAPRELTLSFDPVDDRKQYTGREQGSALRSPFSRRVFRRIPTEPQGARAQRPTRTGRVGLLSF